MINIKGNYNREFYIFDRVSNKYGIKGKELSGYMKIETKGEKGKLKVYIENIDIFENIKYYLKFYVLSADTKCIKSHAVWPVKGIIEREIEFTCNNFEGTDISIDNISIVAVTAEENKDVNISSSIILGAPKKGINEWKDTIEKLESNSTMRTADNELNKLETKIDKQVHHNESNDRKQNKIIVHDYSKDESKIKLDDVNMQKVSNDRIKKDNEDVNKQNKIDIDKIREKFDEYFQKVDPFGTGRRDYEWWWVNNPVFLNNILYDFKLKSPMIFKPEIMDSQFKYKHIIAGIFNEAESNESYFIYGIPGNMDYDKAPEGLHAIWIKAGFDFQGNNTFGYWLIYFEPYTGGIIKV